MYEKYVYNLLVINDEIEFTKNISGLFLETYNIFTASNAQDAITIMEKENIQIVISDKRMPGVGGLDFFSLIKDKYPDAVKLLISGDLDTEAIIGAINEGQVIKYLTKPWKPEELSSVLLDATEKYELITRNKQLVQGMDKSNTQAGEIKKPESGKIINTSSETEIAEKRKQTKEALKENEEKYRTLVEGSLQGMVVALNNPVRLAYASPPMEKICGYSTEELETFGPKQVKGLIHPDDQESFFKAFTDRLSGKDIDQRGTYRIQHKNGSVRWIELFSTLIKYKNEPATQTVFIDITEQKDSKHALQRSEEKQRSYVENSPLGIFVVNGKGKYIDVNPAGCKLLGYSRDELIQLSILDIKNPKESTTTFPELKKEGKISYEGGLRRKDGSIVNVRLDAVALPNDKYIAYCTDITERKKAGAELKKQRDLFELIINSANVSIFWKDLNSVYLGCNTRFAIDAGMKKPEDVIGKDDYAMVWKKNIDQYRTDDQEVISTGEPKLNYVEEFLNIDGEKVWWRTNKMPLRNNDGKIIGVVATAENITERKIAKDAILSSRNRFKKIIALTPIPMIITDTNKDIDYFNNKFIEVFGYTLDDISSLEQWWPLAYPDEDYRREVQITWEKAAKEAEEKNEPIKTQEWNFVRKDRQSRIVEFNMIPLGDISIISMNDVTDSRKAEKTLVYNQQRYEKAQMMGHVGNWEYNPLTTKFWASDEAKRIYGFELESQDFTTEKVESLIPERERVHQALIDLIEHDKKYDLVFDIITNDKGIRKTIHSIAEVETDARGKVKKITGVINDITQRKKADEELLKSEEKYRMLANNSVDVIWRMDLKLNFTYISPNVKEMFGFTQEEWIGTNLGKHSTRKEFFKMARQALISIRNHKSFKHVVFEAKMIKKNGEEIPVEITGRILLNESGFPISLQGSTRDISERIKAESILRETHARHAAMIENIGDVIAVIGTDGITKYQSPNIERWFGWKAEELIGKSDWEKIHPGDVERIREEFFKVLGKESPTTVEYRFKCKDGHYKWIELTAINRVNEPAINGILLNYHDITERKHMELELIGAKDKAEESDRLKSAFLTNMSHEIRTPMNGILGFTDLLKEPELSGERQQKYISIIEKSGDRMLNTINDIIDISKIESKQVEVSISYVNLIKQIDELYEFFLPEAENKNIQFTITNRLPNQYTTIQSDQEKIVSILTNLLKNAIKYTDKGAIEFGISTSSTSSPNEPTSILNRTTEKVNEPDELKFYVKDTGIGIPRERQKAIFNRFVQADFADTRAFEGSGLGLAISKAYVEMLGGKIWVESEEGVGSQFYFTIPFSKNTSEISLQKDESVKRSHSPKKRLKILIVEDEEIAVTYLSVVLRTYKKEILVARTGIEALEICENNPDIDLILMDIRIPKIDGYETTRRIRTFNKDVIILAQTAFAQAGDREKCIEAGCDNYITKPIIKQNLLEMIDGYF